jgi:hypothetical protein
MRELYNLGELGKMALFSSATGSTECLRMCRLRRQSNRHLVDPFDLYLTARARAHAS